MKNKNMLLLMLATLMVACDGSTNSKPNNNLNSTSSSRLPVSTSSSSNQALPSSQSSSVSSSSSSVSTPLPEKDEIIEIKMMGNVYVETMRTAYALVKEGYESDVEWISSNESVVKVSPRGDNTTECTIIGRGYGSATITARLVTTPEHYATFEVTIAEGDAMPENMFNKLKGGMKLVSDDKCLSYDLNLNPSLDEQYRITTIYEETNPSDTDPSNKTDGYQINVYDTLKNKQKENFTYVRGTGSYVSTESLNMYNEIVTKKFTSIDYEDGIRWEQSFYANIWANEEIVTNDMFRTFDGGKTYHYTSTYVSPMYLCASMYLLDMSPDDMYFTYNNDQLQLHVVVDPYNGNELETKLYGRHITTTFSEFNTAKVNHPTPYAHEDHHDTLETAMNNMANARNYTVEVTLDYPGNGDDIAYVYKFSEDTIDELVTRGEEVLSHSGAHKDSESSYYQYTYNHLTNSLIIGEKHNSAWEDVNRYPTFDFAPEIFDLVSTNSYITKDNHGQILSRCIYLGSAFGFYSFDSQATIILDDNGYINKVSTSVDALGDKLVVTATFKDFGTTVQDIDFSNVGDSNLVSSFEEAAPHIHKALISWELEDIIPYLYCPVNYNSVGYAKKRDEDGYAIDEVDYMFVSTKDFGNATDRDQFMADYQALLLQLGFVEDGVHASTGTKLYSKGGYSIGVMVELNWQGKETNKVRIIVVSDSLVAPSLE